MTYCDAWITDASPEDLDQVGLFRDGSPEDAIGTGPIFPEARRAYSLLRHGITDKRFKRFQVDWGSYAGIMLRAELRDFLVEAFGPVGVYEAACASGPTHLANKMRELRAYVDALPHDRLFKVVVEEF